MSLQQNEEWFKARRGKFTGSNFKLLLGEGKSYYTEDLSGERYGMYTSKVLTRALTVNYKGEEKKFNKGDEVAYFKPWFGDTGMSYIRKVVAERMGSYEFPTSNKACDWGNENEPLAVEHYEEDTGYTVEETGFVLHSKYDFAGCSVDGLIVGESGIIEVKNPYNPANFIRYATDEAYILKEHGSQIYGNMWVMESDFCDFIAYDKRNERKPIFIKRFYRDEEKIALLEERVLLAESVANQMYEEILNPNCNSEF